MATGVVAAGAAVDVVAAGTVATGVAAAGAAAAGGPAAGGTAVGGTADGGTVMPVLSMSASTCAGSGLLSTPGNALRRTMPIMPFILSTACPSSSCSGTPKKRRSALTLSWNDMALNAASEASEKQASRKKQWSE